MWASGVKAAGGNGGGEMVNRGNFAANDFWEGDGLTCDDTWRELDLSSKVPDGANFVLLYLRMKSASLGHYFQIKSADHANDYNIITLTSINTTGYMHRTEWIGCSSDRKIKYYGSASLTDAVINVLAWHT